MFLFLFVFGGKPTRDSYYLPRNFTTNFWSPLCPLCTISVLKDLIRIKDLQSFHHYIEFSITCIISYVLSTMLPLCQSKINKFSEIFTNSKQLEICLFHFCLFTKSFSLSIVRPSFSFDYLLAPTSCLLPMGLPFVYAATGFYTNITTPINYDVTVFLKLTRLFTDPFLPVRPKSH